ncbi:MAG: hypothetical protein ACPGVT_04640 [Maricaulaceae bacterium]
MRNKKLILAALLGFAAIFYFTFGQHQTSKTRMECVVQPHQVVLNFYANDVLEQSQSFQGYRVATWHNDSPGSIVRKYTKLQKSEQSTANDDGDRLVAITDANGTFLAQGLMSQDCFDAILVTGQ